MVNQALTTSMEIYEHALKYLRGILPICFLINDLDWICALHGTFFIKLFLNVKKEWFFFKHFFKESRTKNLDKHPLPVLIHDILSTPLINSSF